MPLVSTDAVVLHAFDYLETSRILRLATREAGVQTVLARGARRSQRRFGSAVDLFAQGAAQIYTKSGRDLNTLASFDVVRARPELAADLGRFAGASAVAEMMLRFGRDDSQPALFDTLVAALDAIGTAPPELAREAALAGAWHIVAELGFAPAVDLCGGCHEPLDPEAQAMFSHPAGGVLCARCARMHPGNRVLPASARGALREWIGGGRAGPRADGELRAHQRLLREFLREHLTDGRPLRAFEAWEHDRWSVA
ncbi:MAG TPA: DNA repair protein RecO [Gemmatimonadaceae bacterium]|nr:DNA repair protein RecO [Gemmatimonadaceae bacterium]